ncbi:glycosyltransferase [Lactobacillus kefiranofaciens]|uniref:glycosyltransferase n=1 Tax=Lactobacillus kefiranofaciens TaxID=267818 RepID=UPI0006D029DB|nr:glycosyltransferase [Lactobacillus kefiranofaciens]KRL29708.1 hypothetical protein FC94_GL001960 [Lactobacillus kefiranofaciens subsp. kefirgranum DSM 10550 = JCM 8572]MCJ2173118.1 glycosyltransferase [Lactobacillus kefiranofaciens]
MDTVACIILNYNDYRTTMKLVDNIKEFTVIKHIIIVDNKSSNNSLDILKQHYALIKKIVVISSGKNGGYGFGNNYGIKYAKRVLKSKYAIISNPDVSFSETLVKDLLFLIKEHNAAIVSGSQKIDGEINPPWKLPSALNWALNETKLFHSKALSHYYYNDEYFKDRYSSVDCVRGAMLLVDVDKILDVGGYDETMFLFGEETVLGYKLKKKHYKTLILNHEYYYHNHSTSINKSIPDKIKQQRILYASKLIYMIKYLNTNWVKLTFIKSIFKFEILKSKLKGILK